MRLAAFKLQIVAIAESENNLKNTYVANSLQYLLAMPCFDICRS